MATTTVERAPDGADAASVDKEPGSGDSDKEAVADKEPAAGEIEGADGSAAKAEAAAADGATLVLEIVPDYVLDKAPLPLDTMQRLASDSPVKRKHRPKAVMGEIHTRSQKTTDKAVELNKANADDAPKNVQWMGENIGSLLGLDPRVTITQLMENKEVKSVEKFLQAGGPRVLVFFYQVTSKFGQFKDSDKVSHTKQASEISHTHYGQNVGVPSTFTFYAMLTTLMVGELAPPLFINKFYFPLTRPC